MAANSPTDAAGVAKSGDTENFPVIATVSASENNTNCSSIKNSKTFEQNDVSIFVEDVTMLAALPAGFNGKDIKEQMESAKESHISPKRIKEKSQSADGTESDNEFNEKEKVETTDPESSQCNEGQVEGMCKLMLNVLANSAGVIQVYPKFTQDAVIEIEDGIPASNSVDCNQTESGDDQAERRDTPQAASIPEKISANGLSKDLEDLPKHEDIPLENDMFKALVAIAASERANVNRDMKAQSKVSDQESQNHESNGGTGITDKKNKAMPVEDKWSQSNTTGSEEGSESGKEVTGAGKRRGSSKWKAIAWTIGTLAVNPTLKIKVKPKDQENASVKDTSSESAQEQNKIDDEGEKDEKKNKNNKATQTETQSDVIEDVDVIVDEPKPGPFRMAKMAVVITHTHFINNGDVRIAAIEESETIENDRESLRSKTTDAGGLLVISRAAQATGLDIETGNDVSTMSSSEDGGGAPLLTGGPKHESFCGIWPWQSKKEHQLPSTECLSMDEIHDLRPTPNPTNISIETTTTSTQTEQAEVETQEEITICSERQPGVLGRVWNFMKRRGKRVAVPDVENQLEETRSASATSAAMNTRDCSGVQKRKEPEKNKRDAADSLVEIEMNQLTPPKKDGDNKNATLGPESADHNVIEMDDTTSKEQCGTGHETSDVVTKQPNNNLEHDISMTTSNRATQIEEIFPEQTAINQIETLKTTRNGIFSRAVDWLKRAVCGQHDVNRQLEETVRCDASLGLSTFTVNEEGDLETTTRGKITYVIIMLLAAFNIWKEIRKMFYYIKKDEEKDLKDQTFKYISIAAQAAIFLLLLGHFILIWFGPKMVGKAVKRLRRSPPPANNKSRFSARGLRVFSLFTALYLVLGGYGVLLEAKDYSLKDVWLMQESDLYKTVIPDKYDSVLYKTTTTTTEAIYITRSTASSIVSNSINATLNSTWMGVEKASDNATLQESTNSGGLLLNDGTLETYIFGTISVLLSFIGLVVFSSAADWLLVICFIIWRFVDGALDVANLTLEDEDGNPLTPEELKRRKQLAKITLVEHDRILNISTDLNGTGKFIWPALLLTAIFLCSFVVHLWFRGFWFQSVFYTAPLTKICAILIFAVLISEKVDSYADWFVSEAGRVLLDLDMYEFDRRKAEMKRNPISFGTGPTITSLKFIYSLFGVISSNVILTIQAFFAARG